MAYTPPSGNAANFSAFAYGQQAVAYKQFRMSSADYTAPDGDAVNFVLRGYQYPLGSEANFGASPNAPTVAIECSSAVSFYMKVDDIRDFTVVAGTSTKFEQPYRDFGISTGSAFQSYTWLRNLVFTTTTTVTPRVGAQIHFESSSTLYTPALASIQATSDLVSTSTVAPAWRSFNDSTAIVKAKTTTQLKPGSIRPLVFSVRGDSTVLGVSAKTAKVSFAMSTQTVLAPKPIALAARDTTIQAGATAGFVASALARANATHTGSSEAQFVGQKAWWMSCDIHTASSPSFVSAYTYENLGSLYDVEYVVTCTTRTNVLYVR